MLLWRAGEKSLSNACAPLVSLDCAMLTSAAGACSFLSSSCAPHRHALCTSMPDGASSSASWYWSAISSVGGHEMSLSLPDLAKHNIDLPCFDSPAAFLLDCVNCRLANVDLNAAL